MAFPETPLDVTVELNLDGTWTDITDHTFTREPIDIGRGRSDESSTVDPSSCRLTLDNRDGRFSPRNPTSPYYGQIGRNTPLRVRQGTGGFVQTEDSLHTQTAQTADSAGVSITGDIDVRVDLRPDVWSGFEGGNAQALAAKYVVTGNQRSWAFTLNDSGTMSVRWTTDGTLGTAQDRTSAEVPFADGQRGAVRWTLDVDNGAAGNDVTFYTADTIDGPWTQLGATQTTAGVTSIFDSTALLEFGAAQGLAATYAPIGRIYRGQLYAGLAGTDERADFDPGSAEPGATSYTDEHGKVWGIFNGEVISTSIRFSGEVSSWPQQWDPSGSDVATQVEASGVLRRLGQGADSLRSALYRATSTTDPAPVAYWPFEDEDGAEYAASATPSGVPMTIVTGAPEFAGYESFAGSDPIALLGTAHFRATVNPYTATGFAQIRFVMRTPAETDGARILSVFASGTAREWQLKYRSTGDLQVVILDEDGATLSTGPVVNFNHNDQNVRVSLEMTQDGADIDWGIVTLVAGETTGLVDSQTLAGNTFGRITRIHVNEDTTLGNMAIGHLTVYDEITSIYDLADEITGFDGETAGRRVERLCTEEGVTFRAVGDLDDTTAMGPQTSQPLLDLLRESEAADGGILYEPRDLLGLAYRTRTSLYSQPPRVALDYTDAVTLDPTDDDQNTRNDITVTREGGSSARYVLETGALSVQAPPDGVGRYDEKLTLNLETDDNLLSEAGWRVHLGTVDETRYPRIGVDLGVLADDPGVAAGVREADVGDRIVIENPPEWLPPGDIDQLAQGFAEVLESHVYPVTLVGTPASPWDVGELDDDILGRLDTDGSTLSSGITSTATSMSVATTDSGSPLWTTDSAEMPFSITVGGEEMTVTAISGSSSPQTFTVTRSVNGVVKAHSSGTDVRLTHPLILAL